MMWTLNSIFKETLEEDFQQGLKLKSPLLAGQVSQGLGYAALQISVGGVWLIVIAMALRIVVVVRDRRNIKVIKKEREEAVGSQNSLSIYL